MMWAWQECGRSSSPHMLRRPLRLLACAVGAVAEPLLNCVVARQCHEVQDGIKPAHSMESVGEGSQGMVEVFRGSRVRNQARTWQGRPPAMGQKVGRVWAQMLQVQSKGRRGSRMCIIMCLTKMLARPK